MVGLFHAGPQLGRTVDVAFPGHLGGWLAVFWSAWKPRANPVDLGEAEPRARRADHFSLRSQRRLLGSQAPNGMAVEPCSRRHEVVALRAPGLPPLALPRGARFLVGAQLPDAARH